MNTTMHIINEGFMRKYITENADNKDVFHNDNGEDYTVIERSQSGKNALLNKGKQWIVAWNCPKSNEGSWGQGHYFFDEQEARKVWADAYLNESIKEAKDLSQKNVSTCGEDINKYKSILKTNSVPKNFSQKCVRKVRDESIMESTKKVTHNEIKESANAMNVSNKHIVAEDFNEKNLEKQGTCEYEANANRDKHIKLYRKYANLTEDEEITTDNINEWALSKTATYANREPKRIKAELLGERYSGYEIE